MKVSSVTFGGKTYQLNIGGLSAGLVFGGSVTELVGTASNMKRATDLEGE